MQAIFRDYVMLAKRSLEQTRNIDVFELTLYGSAHCPLAKCVERIVNDKTVRNNSRDQ